MPSPSTHEFSITPEGASAFERVARHLGLSPSQYASSAALKAWVRRNKDSKYVPAYLLDLWGFEVDDELFGKTKPPKPAV